MNLWIFLTQFFGAEALSKLEIVENTHRMLFREYSLQVPNTGLAQETSSVEVNAKKDDSFDDWDRYQSVRRRTQSYSELDAYLADDTVPRIDRFDILNWWKANYAAYLVIARMACDVLSAPASTVAFESAFSTGQRVVSDFRSRLTTDTIEALICLQDWLRAVAPSPEKLLVQVVAPPVYKSTTIANPVSDDTTDHMEDNFGEDAYFV